MTREEEFEITEEEFEITEDVIEECLQESIG
ncbi:hypothetical protein RSJ2_3134 [Clostridium botulinum]|nr:hypothetical protein NPD2_1750 [Clostridium botulinum]APC83314.1 hypothetical protein NPD12_3325 [Clostridium botulinum]APH17651.1 hypothetical protein NPD3_1904 [Clostridium botulinum]APH22590.1 hypothetical protein NPD1_766 [Clostridium botulinum]APQ70619.1 hypothetical protein RSJ8_2978 [Clostridium botulinum]